MEIITIIFGVFAFAALILFAIIIYNQMLMVNEVNKRLLLLTKESVEKERLTMAELESWIRSSGNNDAPVTNTKVEANDNFDPFSYNGEEKKEETDL